jgi:PKD repeat protein
MKSIFLTLLLIVSAVLFSSAQLPLVSIHGRVIYQETGAPAIGQTVLISIDSLQNYGHYSKVVTDANGEYIDYVPYMSGIDQQAIYVYTYDCRGDMVKGEGYFRVGKLEVVINLDICSNSATQCEAFFKFSPNPNDLLEVAFYDGSQFLPGSAKMEYTWNFGDSTSANGQYPIHAYNKSGVYNVCFSISSSDNKCSSTICLPVKVGSPTPDPCESSFIYYLDSLDNQYVFEGLAINQQTTEWKWNFGDGTTATGQKVSRSFANLNANHTVCLTTTGVDADGTTCTHSYCQDIFVYIPSPCESSFFYYTDSIGSNYTFEGYAKNNLVNYWAWDFGDGTTATGQKVSHSFNFNSTVGHNVCLKTIGIGASGDSCTFNSCQNININPPSPCENYFKTYSGDGSKYTFTGEVASGVNASYYWNFGDGTSDTGQVVKHTFGKKNTIFNVCLTTIVSVPAPTGFYECKSISCQTVFNVNDSSGCKAVFLAVPDSSTNTYSFINQSQSNYTYSYWNFGDGSQSTEANPVHIYSSPGLYIACLTIADNTNNCKSQSCQEIRVNMIQPGCKASFYTISPDSLANSVHFKFINTSTEGLYSNQKWSFGDGTGSTDFNPIHTYVTPGIYTACLTIWDSSGSCQSSYCKEIFAGEVKVDNTVSGIVLAGNKVADQGIVWLISPDNNYNAEKVIDSTGTYHFTGVPYGKYYIYAMLTPGSTEFFAYMPTYYGNSLSWQGATIINAGEPNAWYQVNLISSKVLSSGDATITGTIFWSGNSKAEGIPAANVEVVLYNNSGNPIAYTFTDSEGTFEFNNLPFGEYTVQAEMPGKATQLISVSLSENSSAVNLDLRVNESAVYILSIETPNKTLILAGNLYPNPVTDILTMELNAPVSGTATVEVIDMQGRVIHRELTELSSGHNRVRIQTGDLNKGVYQLRIKTDGQKPVQRRFVR